MVQECDICTIIEKIVWNIAIEWWKKIRWAVSEIRGIPPKENKHISFKNLGIPGCDFCL